MKIRNGFVSNSSSSSFVIQKKDITAEQLTQINKHADEAGSESWGITETDTTIEGWTMMDNFDMEEYLEKIGVVIVEWGCHQ